MKKILLFITVLFCLCSLKGYAQIGYKFTRAQESIVTSGDVGSYISNLNKFTVEFWARPSANSNLMFTSIYVPGSAGQTELGGFGLYQNTLIVSIGSDFAGFSQSIDLGNRLSTVGWHHFAYVYNGADWLFYVDGSLISSNSDQEGLNGATPNYSGSGLTQFKIGGLSDGSTVTGALDYFDGSMDDFRVWNTARTQAQLSSNRTVELTGTETGLVLYYKLNEQSGQVVNNSTALSLNGVRGSTSGTETQDPAINQLGIVTGPPITTTNAATSITGAGAATLNGTVNDNGGTATVSFDYSTNSTLSSGVTTVSATTGGTVNAGTGNTSSSVGLTGLTAGTTYYFRVKASNAGGSSNGSILNFTIPASSPTVSTDAVTSITTSSATMGGNVSAAGATAVSERGVVYATTINPTTSATKALTGSGTGTFTGTVSGLSPATTYHVRAYAINTIGTSYGADQSFTTQAVTAQPTVASPSNGSLITTTAPNYTGTATAGATVTVYVDGASLGNTIATGGNWSLTQPTALAQGSHTVYATAQVSGNAVSANSTTNTFTIDSTRPSVVITSTAGASGSSTSTSPIPFTVTFSETVTGFVAGDITPGNTTISGFSGSGTTYTFNATPTTNGAVTISIAANVALDAAGNGNTAASAFSITYAPATAAPVLIIPSNNGTTTSTKPAYAGTAPAGSIITIYVDGIALSNTTTATSGGNWAIFQPTDLGEGSHTVYATAQSSGNSVSANSNTNTFTVDSQRPSVVITSTAGASGSSTSTSPIPFTVTFSEAVTGFVAGDITPGNATISGFSGSGTTYTFNATPIASGLVNINVAANVAQDAATNGNTAASPFSITYTQASQITASAGSFPSALSTTYGTASTSTSVTVSGTGLSAGITATPSSTSNFEVSADNVNYNSSVTIGSSGTVSGTVYVRLKANAPAGTNITGNVVLTSSGANSQTVSIPSSTVAKATLTYTANTSSKVYGDAVPALSGTVTGFVNSETISTATTGTISWSTSATTNSAAGSYGITGTGLSASNYDFVQASVNSTALTITQKMITVTAAAKSKTYGDADPALTYTFAPALVGTDTFTGSLSRLPGENVGTYAINQGTLALNGNYT
ncbi:MBG domain-containing protein, partial [Pedobacter sp. AJM]|uniref:MBG domain-containing protein n=1 Tax=Pedobacter sp. AJM TaxID=2003629 RepID=UPI001552521F